jgi:mercuric ion transport protein
MSSALESKPQDGAAGTGSAPALTLAALAAMLASTCCVLPLVFALAGISGAWIVQLRVLEPYSSTLTVLALVALALAGWRLYRPQAQADAACAVGNGACGPVNAAARRWFWLVAVLTLVPLLVPLAAPLFY